MTTNTHTVKTLICDFCLNELPSGTTFYTPLLGNPEYYQVIWHLPNDETIRMDSCVECQKALKEFIDACRAPALKECKSEKKDFKHGDENSL